MKKTLAFILSLMIICGMMPIEHTFVYADSSNEKTETSYGTPGTDYEPGEVIVCVKGGKKALTDSGLFDKKPLLSASSNSIKVDETLYTFNSDEEQVDRIADEGETPLKVSLQSNNNDEKYSLILLKSGKKDVTEFIAELEKLSCVMFAEPNLICTTEAYAVSDATSEPYYNYQWYSKNNIKDGGIDTNAESAYTNSSFENQKEVVVAIMDTGVDYTHPDLAQSMWNAGESTAGLIGFDGGIYGINTSGDGESNDPMDVSSGHGTHCASIVASTWNNQEGTAGINGNAKIMACRWISDEGIISNYIKAMEYVIAAKKSGVNVVATNNSWGVNSEIGVTSNSVELIVEEAAKCGILSCFAAGNDEYDHDRYTNLAYASPYCLTVGAMDSNGDPALFSDRGARTVDVFAPGTQILAATSTKISVDPMISQLIPQYLPWVQDPSDSFLYEDFENWEDNKVSLSSYSFTSKSVMSEDGDFMTCDDELKYTTAGSSCDFSFSGNKSCKLGVDNNIAVDDQLAIEFDIPLSYILTNNGELPESETGTYYFAFQAKAENLDFHILDSYYNSIENYAELKYCISASDGDGGFLNFWNTLNSWNRTDSNWNLDSMEIDKDNMEGLVEAAGTTDDILKLRLELTVDNISSDANWYIDSIGFGTNNSDYYYADGTSMATPVTTAIASIIAGSMNEYPDSSEDVLDIIARIKGGVERTGTNLTDVCTTGGCVQADSAFKTESELNPVPDAVVLNNNGTATINGHFFGNINGSVKVNNKNADIVKWENNEIKIKVPDDTKTGSLEYTVKRSDDKSGREFGVFVEKTGDKYYETLPMGDFSYGDSLKSTDLLPVRMAANEDGIMALLVDADSEILGLEFYSFVENVWTKIEPPEDIDIFPNILAMCYSIVGGKDQFYLLCQSTGDEYSDGENWLLTYSTKEKEWIYTVKRENVDSESGEFLALDKDGKLYLGGGDGNDSSILQVYPDKGTYSMKKYDFPEIDLTCGGDFLISGDMHILAGMNGGKNAVIFGPYLDYPITEVNNPVVLNKDGEWVEKETPFFELEDETSDGKDGFGLDHDQLYTGAYGALDTGFILTGPSRDIDKDSMVDTWIYNAEDDTYTALDARVDSLRLKMQAGVCRNGKFYVMGNSVKDDKTFFKCLDLEKFGVKSTDNDKNAELEESNPCVTAFGSTWLSDDSGYYILDEEGNLTNDGANAKNYQVAFDSNRNMITLRDIDIEGMQDSKASSDIKSGIYSKKDLTIRLIGDNSFNVPCDDEIDDISPDTFGIYCKGNISFVGNGNLDIKSGKRAYSNYAIYSEKSINFKSSGIINCTGELIHEDIIKEDIWYLFDGTDAIATYGVKALEQVNVNKGTVNINAEDIELTDDEEGSIYDSGSDLYESIGIDADTVNVSGNAVLNVKTGNISSTGGDRDGIMNSIAIRTKNPVKIGKSTITTTIGRLYDLKNKETVANGSNGCTNLAFTIAPVLDDYIEAQLWYGDNKSDAISMGPKEFNNISHILLEKYICIKTKYDIPIPIVDPEPTPDPKPDPEPDPEPTPDPQEEEIKILKEMVNKSQVSSVKTTALKNGKIKITFKRLKLKNGDKVQTYQVYRKVKNGKYKKIATINNKKSTKNITFTNSKNLKKGKKYYYKIRGSVKLSDGKVAYTKWSKVKSAKCKKTRKK